MTPNGSAVDRADTADEAAIVKQHGEGGGSVAASPRTWTVPLLFSKPPLTLNQRKHWTYRARISREVHAQIIWQVRRLKVPALSCPVVTLHYAPPDKRRRDADNLIATAKVALDGLVLAGVLEDDDPVHVDHRMPVIAPPERPARMWLEIKAADE